MMVQDIVDNDRMNIFLNCLSNIDEHMKLPQIKEHYKMFGVASEIFEESLVPFVPKMLANFAKRIREDGTTRLHVTISETIG